MTGGHNVDMAGCMGAENLPEGVLVVMEDQAVGADVVATLHTSGYHVLPVRSLPEARARLQRHAGAAVLLVVERPDRTVLGFCQELREVHGMQLVIMLLCGPGPVQPRTVALELGADDVLVMPVPPDELLARLAAHRRRLQMRRGM